MGLQIDILNKFLKDNNITLNSTQIEKLFQFEEKVIETNEKFNLTNITTEPDFTIKHIIDSLVGIPHIPEGAKLLDIGTGAGFPSMPIAISRPDLKIEAIDSTEKKIGFVNQSAKELGVSNIKAISIRAEEMPKDNKYDCVVARAVAALPILLELAMPIINVGGLFIAYKATEDELKDSANALKVLNSKVEKTVSLTLPNGDNRCLIIIKKLGETPNKYPRNYSQIKKKPL
ncbi:MAG: 16S rRNA (guanine(527)-N(7))-methyltransferase RsmG [Clostridia bacterium]|nr:16S rRNA (guanine(527)-N(7))-methyltransferase RsmG [Clostridia bacterium]